MYVWTVEMYEESKLKELRQLQREVEQLRKIRNKMKNCWVIASSEEEEDFHLEYYTWRMSLEDG